MKRIIIALAIFSLFLTACNTLNGSPKVLVYPNKTIQWASSASASSAYGGIIGEQRDDQSPFAATGEPDVELCQDDTHAWVIEEEDDGEHWLEVKFDKEVFVSGIKVRETLGPGAVSKIELLSGTEYKTFWEGEDPNTACPGYFEAVYQENINNITKEMTSYKTNTARITIDTDVAGWNEIDAVQLTGYDQRWYVFNNTIEYE